MVDDTTLGDLAGLLPSWRRHLRAENKSARTVQSYPRRPNSSGRSWPTGMPTDVGELTRQHVEAFLEYLFDAGRSPSTVANRYRSLQQLFRWLDDDGRFPARPWTGCARPRCPTSRCRC